MPDYEPIDVDVEAVEIVADSSVVTAVEEGDQFTTVRVFPALVIFATLLNWTFFVYGILFLANSSLSLNTPLSPPIKSWYFYTVSNWPDCSDMRSQHSRLFTYQFIHASPMHIIGNTFAALTYGENHSYGLLYYFFSQISIYLKYNNAAESELGCVINIYMGNIKTGVIYISAIFMGSLGHSLVWPFKGLIGCSGGVYGLMGACWVLFLFHFHKLDRVVAFVLPFALSIQLIGDIVSYCLFYASSMGYVCHFFGYIAGMTVALAYLLVEDCSPVHQTTWSLKAVRMAVGLIGTLGFATIATFLIYHYVEEWPPSAVQRGFLHNTGEGRCCAQLFTYADSNELSVAQAKEETSCYNGILYSLAGDDNNQYGYYQ